MSHPLNFTVNVNDTEINCHHIVAFVYLCTGEWKVFVQQTLVLLIFLFCILVLVSYTFRYSKTGRKIIRECVYCCLIQRPNLADQENSRDDSQDQNIAMMEFGPGPDPSN